MEVIDLQCDTNLIQTCSETKLQDFYSYLQKDKFPQLRYLGVELFPAFGSTNLRTNSFCLWRI